MPTHTCYADLPIDEGEDFELIVTFTPFPAEPDVGIFQPQIEITDIEGLPEGLTLTDLEPAILHDLQAQIRDGYEPDYPEYEREPDYD